MISIDDQMKFDEISDWTHPLIARRVPVVATSHPRWKYHVVLSKDNLWTHDPNVETTEQENDQLVAYLDFRLRWYNESYRKQMFEKYPFDVDSGVNTIIFRKSWRFGWGYRMASFEGGYSWYPQWDKPETHYRDLVDLFDRVQNLVPERWEAFKTENPTIWRKY